LDTWIAAIARHEGLPVISRDARDAHFDTDHPLRWTQAAV